MRIKPKKKIGLIMVSPVLDKNRISTESVPPWLQSMSFKPNGTKSNTIEITDFLKFSEKIRLRNMYFSTPNISKVRAVFRKDEITKKEQYNKNLFRGLIKMTTTDYKNAVTSIKKHELDSLLRIDSISARYDKK